MKDVLVFLSPASGDLLPAGAHYGLALARVYGAELSALIAELEPLNELPEPVNMQVDAANSLSSSSPTRRLAQTADLISAAANSANVSCEVFGTGSGCLSLRERVICLA